MEPGKLTYALLGNSWNQLETSVGTSGVGTSGVRTSGVRTPGLRKKEALCVKDMKVTKEAAGIPEEAGLKRALGSCFC